MAWIRLSDDYNDHPKFRALSDGSFRLWHEAMAYCRKYQTDGSIAKATMLRFHSYTSKRLQQLLTPWMEGRHPLLKAVESGFSVHDYLDWNLGKEEENQQREEAKQRMALGRDPAMRRALRDRDGFACRYCARVVNWTDRRGPGGATYDHVDPRGGDGLGNLVIACRGCNSKKGKRTPVEAGMVLLEIPKSVSKSDFNSNLDSSGNGTGNGSSGSEEKTVANSRRPFPREHLISAPDPDVLLDRAARLLERYAELFYLHRRGARYHNRMHLDYEKAQQLVRTWTDDVRLEKLAVLILTTDDDWISRTDRGFAIFALKATWADDRLKEWELQNGVA